MTSAQFAVDWEKRIDFARLRGKRLQKTREAMANHSLDALLLFKPENIRYVSGVKGREAFWAISECAFVPKVGDLTVFHTFHESQSRVPWLHGRIRPVRPLEQRGSVVELFCSEFAAEIKELMDEAGLVGGRMGIDIMNYPVYRSLVDAGLSIADGAEAMIDATAIKTTDEIELMKVACGMADAALLNCRGFIRPGVREYDISATLIHTLRTLGSDWYIRGGICSGDRTNPFLPTMGGTDRIIQPGDLVIIDCTHAYLGYWGDVTRTFLCGDRATEHQKSLYRQCYEMLQAGIEEVNPGKTTADIAAAWRRFEEVEGYATHGVVHGVGILLDTAPLLNPLSEKYPEEFLPKMALTVESFVGKGSEGVYLEEHLVVTEDGCELISRCPFEDELLM